MQKTTRMPAILLIVISKLTLATAALTAAPTADELLRMAEQTINPDIYSSAMRITTVKPGQRDAELAMDILYKRDAGSFIEMTAPARSRGLRFLEKDTTLYMYNPRSNSRRPIRLSPEQSFQGTVFSNNDVSDPQYTDDYSAGIRGEEVIDHADFGKVRCIVVDAAAKRPEAPYGRIRMWIHAEKLLPLRFDYYAKSGLLFKTMELKGYRELAGALRPGIMHMDSLELEGSWSEVVTDKMERLEDIPDSQFSTTALIR